GDVRQSPHRPRPGDPSGRARFHPDDRIRLVRIPAVRNAPRRHPPRRGHPCGDAAGAGYETVYLTVLLPSGTRPAGGWPVAIVAAPAGTSRNVGTHLLAAFNAAQGIATIGITSPGSAFGPESTLTVNLAAGGSLTFREGGRSYDQDGNNVIGGAEGSAA